MELKIVKHKKEWWKFWKNNENEKEETELWIMEVTENGEWKNTIYFGNKYSREISLENSGRATIKTPNHSIYLIVGKGDLIIDDGWVISGVKEGYTIFGKIQGDEFKKIGGKLGDKIIDLKENVSLYIRD